MYSGSGFFDSPTNGGLSGKRVFVIGNSMLTMKGLNRGSNDHTYRGANTRGQNTRDGRYENDSPFSMLPI